MKIIVSLIFCVIFLLANCAKALTYVEPKTVRDLERTSVMITDLNERTGGSGSIYRSYKTGSHILTNKHVCRLIEQGGYVRYKSWKFVISHYKKFPRHDLCFVRVPSNLKVNLKVSRTLPLHSDFTAVSGHPSLLPHIVTKGHFSKHQDIDLIVGIRKCTPEEIAKQGIKCFWFGGMPVTKTFDSQVVSNLIMPGSSGSAVFNEEGHIAGVIYAGDGRRDVTFGYIVPHIYVIYFIQNAHRFKWVKVGTKVEDSQFIKRYFNYEKCRNTSLKKIKKFCRSVKDSLIWRK